MSNLDKSLDDLIKMNKKSGAAAGAGGGGSNPRGARARNSGPGPSRRLPNRTSNRSTPYSFGKVQAPETNWQHDMFADHAAAVAYSAQVGRVSAIETGTKLLISNLDYGVSIEDIKELFSEVGDLKRYSIHYDRSGRSKGTAEVVFSRRKDAEAAVKRYNNVQLDGKPMKVEIVGTNIATPAAPSLLPPLLPPPSTNVLYGNQNRAPRSTAIKDEVVPLDNLEVVAEGLEGIAIVDRVEVVVKRYQRKILMLIWRSTTRKQCKQIEGKKC
ncbi:unnamed protein product [Camellia sinensis]